MNVNRMRSIDRRLGVPLCRLAALLRPLLPRPVHPPRRVLFIELSEMGSAILADPALRALRKALDAELFFAIFRRNRTSLRLLDTVPEEHVFGIRDDSLAALAADTLGFLRWTRKHRIDAVVDLELFSRFTALLTAFSGAAYRVGFDAFHGEGLYRGRWLTHPVLYNPHLHMARNFMALARALTHPQPQAPYSKTRIDDEDIRLARAQISDASRTAVREQVRRAYPWYDPGAHRLVLVNPDMTEWIPQRRWMPDRYAEVIWKVLESYPDSLVLVTGSRTEHPAAGALVSRVDNPRCLNFAGALRLTELPALYELAAVMLTGDSGPAHFAAVTDLPTYVIFGPETPALYGALGNTRCIHAGLACSPCVTAANHRRSACRDNVCLKAITVEQVFARLRETLD